MKKNVMDLETVKQKILALKDSPIKMAVNKGRNKIVQIDCTIVSVYPSVFTIQSKNQNLLGDKTFSYFDVLCGDVKILEK